MPRNTTSSVFFYVYVLESLKDGERYIGYTNNLKKIEEHKDAKGRGIISRYEILIFKIYHLQAKTLLTAFGAGR